MTRGDKVLIVAAVVSVALHIAALLGTPRFDIGWLYEQRAAPPLEVRLVPPERPATVAPPEPKSEPVVAPAPKPRAVAPKAEPKPSPPVARIERLGPEVLTGPSEAARALPPGAGAGADRSGAAKSPAELTSAPPAAAQPRAEPIAVYPVKRARLVFDLFHGQSKTKIGQVTQTWRTEGDRYHAESVVEAIGFFSLFFGSKFVQLSEGHLGPAGLVPERYTLERGRGAAPEVAQFDWKDGTLELDSRGERKSVELPQGAQDALSVLHQIYFMRPLPQSSYLNIATGRKLNRYVYEVLGDADLETPLGMLRTLHIGRVEEDGSVLELWLDRDRDLLPVRVYSIDRKGTILDQVVREAHLSG